MVTTPMLPVSGFAPNKPPPLFLNSLLSNLNLQHILLASSGFISEFMKFEEFKKTIDINFLSIHCLLENIVPEMKKKRDGKIVVISSLASFVASPTSLAYSSSKRALNSYTESLRNQLYPYNIKVINIQPGFIESEMTAKNRFKMPFFMSLKEGIDKIEWGIAKNKSEYSFPFLFATFVKFISILPNFIKDRVLRKLNNFE